MSIEKDLEQNKKKKHHRGRRQKKTWKDHLMNAVFVIAIGVFAFSGFKLYEIITEYQKGSMEYTKIQEDVVEESKVTIETFDEELQETVEKTRTSLSIDFESLKKKNQDVVAWIYFENPEVINYPVVAGVDNNYYLKRTLEKKYNSAGTLFIDMNNSNNLSDKNTFIYGHNMKNGSMFGQLKKYRNLEFRNENPYFYIYTPDGIEHTYEIFATCIVDVNSNSYDMDYANNGEFLGYVYQQMDCSQYSSSVNVEEDDYIVSLSTCTNRTKTERLIVHGVKIEERKVSDVNKIGE